MTEPANELRLQITGMDCAACARTIESGVAKLKDVDSAALNFTTGTLRVCGPVAPERVVARVRELGYDVEGRRTTADDGPRTTADDRPPTAGHCFLTHGPPPPPPAAPADREPWPRTRPASRRGRRR